MSDARRSTLFPACSLCELFQRGVTEMLADLRAHYICPHPLDAARV